MGDQHAFFDRARLASWRTDGGDTRGLQQSQGRPTRAGCQRGWSRTCLRWSGCWRCHGEWQHQRHRRNRKWLRRSGGLGSCGQWQQQHRRYSGLWWDVCSTWGRLNTRHGRAPPPRKALRQTLFEIGSFHPQSAALPTIAPTRVKRTRQRPEGWNSPGERRSVCAAWLQAAAHHPRSSCPTSAEPGVPYRPWQPNAALPNLFFNCPPFDRLHL
jgi:hypothetical protein